MKRLTVGLAVGAMILAGATQVWAGAAPQAVPEDAMTKGLRERGLTSLLELYMRQRPAVTSTGSGSVGLIVAGNDKRTLALMEVTKAEAAVNVGEREEGFKKARQYYEEAIADATKSLATTTSAEERTRLSIQVMRVRLELANMIFQKWLKTDLDFLEVTDRRAGDRAHATELMKTSMDQFRGISLEVQKILAIMDRMTLEERQKAFNTSNLEIRKIEREAKYSEAWVTYYYGWILKPDFKPDRARNERSKTELLNDAITQFGDYAKLGDKTSTKWYALMVMGLAYRDLGKYDEALQKLAEADACNALKEDEREGLKIRIVFERSLTLLKKGDCQGARKAVDDAKQFWGPKLEKYVYGVSLPLIEAEAWQDEGLKTDNLPLKKKGDDLFSALAAKPNPWPVLIQGIQDAKFPLAVNDVEKAPPLTIWMKANKLMEDGHNADGSVKDPKALATAADLFAKYAEKVGPRDPNFADALYRSGACYLALKRKTEAGIAFYKVASGRPDFQYAAPAAKYYINLMGEVYQDVKNKSDLSKTEKARQDYEKALKWYCESYGKDDFDQWFNYAIILQEGGGENLHKAVIEFAKIPVKSAQYADAQYWIPLCDLKYFREKEAIGKADVAISRARTVAKELVDYTNFALDRVKTVTEPDAKKILTDRARLAYFNAADILMYPEVNLPADALPILTTIGTKFTLDEEMKGSVLSLLMNAYLKLNKLDEANKVLDDFLKLAKPEEVGPVLRGFFKAMIENVRGLVERKQLEQASQRVDDAKKLGDRLRAWIENHRKDVTDPDLQIEGIRYDLAELYLAVGNFVTAQALYHEIGGAKPWDDPKNGKPLKEDLVYGLARAYTGLAEAEPDATKQKQLFETAFEIWSVLLQALDSRDVNRTDPAAILAQQQLVWDRTYQVYYARFRSNPQQNAQEVFNTLRDRKAIIGGEERLGGKDAVLQQKFENLFSETAKIVGATAAATPAPAVTDTAPAATNTAQTTEKPPATPAPTGTEAAAPTATAATTATAPAATATAPAPAATATAPAGAPAAVAPAATASAAAAKG